MAAMSIRAKSGHTVGKIHRHRGKNGKKKLVLLAKKKVKHVLFISLWPWLQKWGYGTTEFEHNIAFIN